jgi:hypothetical protein
MAASPVGILIALALPEPDLPEFAVRLVDGSRLAVESVGGTLLGGDLVRSPGPLMIDLDTYRERFPDGWRAAVSEDVKVRLYDIDPDLIDAEVSEIVQDALERGGLVDDLLQDYYTRQMDWVRSLDARAPDELDGFEPDGQAGAAAEGGGSGGGGRQPEPGEARGSAADRVGGGEAGGLSEQTGAGDQFLIP